MESLPTCETLLLKVESDVLHVTLNRPDTRNAMSFAMVSDLESVLDAIEQDRGWRAVVLRGAGGHFCSGGDVRDMASALSTGDKEGRGPDSAGLGDPLAAANRRFGTMAERLGRVAATTIAVLEGSVLGGGFGLACVVDVALASRDVRFRLPETSMGLIPAQIAPFLVRRLGLSQARRLALTGASLNAEDALRLGLVHQVVPPGAEIDLALEDILNRVRRTGPRASAATKRLLLRVGQVPIDALLDQAAVEFAAAARSSEGQEGMMAFVQKRPPSWSKPKPA